MSPCEELTRVVEADPAAQRGRADSGQRHRAGGRRRRREACHRALRARIIRPPCGSSSPWCISPTC